MIRKKRIGLVVVAAIVVVGGLSLSGKQGFVSLYKNHINYRQQQTQLLQAHATIDSLNSEISRLRTDTNYIEKIARERLGMAKKNEKIYKFVDQ